MKGLSPGAALVFLLAGPATNITSLTVIAGILGRKAAAVYLSTIVVFSVFLGVATNAFYKTLGLDASRWLTDGMTETPGLFSIACGVVLSVLLLRAVAVRFLSR